MTPVGHGDGGVAADAVSPAPPQVLNSRAIRAKTVIGVFQVRDRARGPGRDAAVRPLSPPSPSPQLDVGTVYRAPGRREGWRDTMGDTGVTPG